MNVVLDRFTSSGNVQESNERFHESASGAGGIDAVARALAATANTNVNAITGQPGEVIPPGTVVVTPEGNFENATAGNITLDATDPQTAASVQAAGLTPATSTGGGHVTITHTAVLPVLENTEPNTIVRYYLAAEAPITNDASSDNQPRVVYPIADGTDVNSEIEVVRISAAAAQLDGNIQGGNAFFNESNKIATFKWDGVSQWIPVR